MTLGGVSFFYLYVAGSILAIFLLVHVLRRDRQQERSNGVAGLASLDTLPWGGWTPSMGWPPMTCWPGCRDFHREDWWRAYLNQTCWDGCTDLHREDWWRAFVDQAD